MQYFNKKNVVKVLNEANINKPEVGQLKFSFLVVKPKRYLIVLTYNLLRVK